MTDKFVSKYTSDEIEEILDKANNLQNYSTEEQIIGTWIDGKPIYQKTITDTATIVSGWNSIFENLTPSNVETVISLTGFEKGQYTHTIPLPYVYLNSTTPQCLVCLYDPINFPNYIRFYSYGTITGNLNLTLTIQYTKTTD